MRTAAPVLFLSITSLFVTSCKESTATSDPRCADNACAEQRVSKYTPRFAVDWDAGDPEFSALFQIVDESNRPLEGANVRIDGRRARSDENGDIPFDALAASGRIVVRADLPGYMPMFTTTNYTASGLQKQRITMLRLEDAQTLDTREPVTLQQGDAQWQFPSSPFVDVSGQPIGQPVQVKMMSVPAEAVARSAIPSDNVAVDEEGRTTLIREQVSLIFTEITDNQGAPVVFAPGTSAKLSLRLPSSVARRMSDGKRLGLFSLDLDRAQWIKESECEVQPAGDGSGDRMCLGAVEHFSYWLVAEEFDIYDPSGFGCVNMYVDTSEIKGLLDGQGPQKPFVGRYPLHVCDGDDCRLDSTFFYGQVAHVRPGDKQPYPSLCGVTEAGGDYRFTAGVIRPGQTSFMVSQDFVLESLAGVTGSEELLNQMLDPQRDCPSLCQQVVIKPSMADLLANLSDDDKDGYFAPENEDDADRLISVDCDDSDPATHPGAFETLCDDIDRNCDGRSAKDSPTYKPGGKLEDYTKCTFRPEDVTATKPLCPYVWNRHCSEACFETTDEVPGDGYDDDCDGRVIDADDDGFDRYGALKPERDCNDYNADANPDGTEVPGNWVDEDCDGIALDADGDGFYAFGHELAAEALGLTGGNVDLEMMFGDCNDSDPTVNPGVLPEQESGQMADLFLYDEEGPSGRLAHYCDYFLADGSPSQLFRRRVRDLNCDGVITDADGDMLTTPGDTSLGEGLDVDCDDYDPRLSAELDSAGELTCENLDRSNLANASECEPATGAQGQVGPALECPLLASYIETECVSVTDEVALCIYPGWEARNPLRLTPGVLWGPCDGPARLLPDCPSGAACGSPVAYSDELINYLKDVFTDGEPLEFQGMCFRTCEDQPSGSE